MSAVMLRLLLVATLSGASVAHAVHLFGKAERGMVTTVNQQPTDKPHPNKETAGELLKQSTEFQGWTVLILGGVIAALITTKVHANCRPEWTFIPFGPATTYLFFSLLAAWELKKRHNYLLFRNNFDDLMSVANHLSVQFQLLGWAGLCLTIVGAWFLILILAGQIKPDQKEKE
jgi:hypothetical protein